MIIAAKGKGAMTMKHKCDYADELDAQGYCKHKRYKCDGCGDVFLIPDCIDRLTVVERKDICKKSSLWGNYYITMNAQDVANLISGKCLALTGEEYNFFISYDGGASDGE